MPRGRCGKTRHQSQRPLQGRGREVGGGRMHAPRSGAGCPENGRRATRAGGESSAGLDSEGKGSGAPRARWSPSWSTLWRDGQSEMGAVHVGFSRKTAAVSTWSRYRWHPMEGTSPPLRSTGGIWAYYPTTSQNRCAALFIEWISAPCQRKNTTQSRRCPNSHIGTAASKNTMRHMRGCLRWSARALSTTEAALTTAKLSTKR